jgi:glycosyltransferase involved in cell wall biosynthesis
VLRDAPIVDLVLPTVERTTELDRFLESLAAQSFRRFRLIVIDQNQDDRLLPILARYEEAVPVLSVASLPGASRARNVGLQHVQGDLVGLPDDDCWYPSDLLEKVVDLLNRRPELDGVGGRTVDVAGRSSFVRWANADKPAAIRHGNVWRTAVAVTIFLRRNVVDSLDGFDETLGVGSGTPWGSGEETDYVLRALASGFRLEYDPSIVVYHESPNPAFSRSAAARAYAYGMGNSRVLRKHGYGSWFALYRVLQLVAGATVFLGRARFAHAWFYWAMARGRAVGWFKASK